MVASSSTGESYANPIDLEDDDDVLVVGSRPRRRVRARRNLTPPNIADARSSQQLSNSETAAPAEERVKPFREMPPTGFAARRERALSQRLYVLARERRLSAAGTHEEELIEISGSTGKPYEVTISKLLKCSCPDHYIRRDLCKHIIYVSIFLLS